MRTTWKALAVLTVIFFIAAVSAGCARRPRPTAAPAPPAEAPAPDTKEEAPAIAAEPEPPYRTGEVSAPTPTEGTPGRMAEERVARGEEGSEVAAVEELEDIHFGFDRYDIRPDARPALEKNAQWIREHPQARVQIEGHCDERGTVEYNLALGDRRARSTRDYLISLGVDPGQLSTVSFGEERPLDPDHNEEAWARNRRAHFVLLK